MNKFPLVLMIGLAGTAGHVLRAEQTAVAPGAANAEVDAAIQKVVPALVRIYVVMEEGADGRMRKMQGSGSGAIISPEGHVLTNHHVAGRGTRFVCTLSDYEEVDATLVGTDALSDLAVLKLDLATRRFPDRPLAVAKFGDSDQLKVGDYVYAMGSPGGLSQSVTRGIVANAAMIVPRHQIGLTLDGEKVGELVRWIGHDAVIYPGNSGGPLVNLKGEIVGVNEVGIASLGGAIPSNLAKKVAEELIAKGHVTRGWIGLEVQPLLRTMAKRKGALVASVWKGSPAAEAGILPGDFVTEYNGSVIPDCHAAEDIPLFNTMVLATAPGSEVVVRGERDGKAMEWKMKVLDRQPNQAKESEMKEWGLTVRDFTRVSALEKFRANSEGVLVDTVRSGGPSAEAKPGLRSGDILLKVGGEPVKDRRGLEEKTERFIEGLEEPKPWLVEFERDGQVWATVVKLGPKQDPVKAKLAEKAWLGTETQVLTDELAEALGVKGKKGVRVVSVSPDSPASAGGLLAGDLILKMDGKVLPVRRPEDQDVFRDLVASYSVDTEVELAGMRGEEEKAWKVKLAPRPVTDAELLEYKDTTFELTVKQLSARQVDQLKERFGEEPKGIMVTQVEPSGWASLAGLVADDQLLTIDGKEANQIEEFRKILKELEEAKPRSVVFGIRRGARTQYLEIEPRW